MTPHSLARPAAVLAAGVLLGFTAGCGGKNPPAHAAKGKDKTAVPANISEPSGTPSTAGGFALLSPQDPAQRAAELFVAQIGRKEVDADSSKLTQGFLELIGKPARSDSDRTRKYSGHEAANWLGGVGGKMGLTGMPTGYTADGVAVFAGSLQPSGRYLLRLVREGNDWKLDWFQTAHTAAMVPDKVGSADEAFRGFTTQAFLDALTDKGAMTPDERAPLVAALVSNDLRQAWAGPLPGDKEALLDYNKARMKDRLLSLRGAAEGYSLPATAADGVYRGDLTEGGAKKPYSIRVAKSPAGRWEVVEFTR
jgi:hypothetical protein